ncbi:hypothetical protein CVT25_003810 [Psilocybe cyanescens]|uniref:Uncharacterized protein n=1 Tax=Psilocybe cyanescens TaxID=93625 RepID=A0A409WXA7_PSICY|nr:hypothetical protein CVT25_003810 [Psilocybe cyanescens]
MDLKQQATTRLPEDPLERFQVIPSHSILSPYARSKRRDPGGETAGRDITDEIRSTLVASEAHSLQI